MKMKRGRGLLGVIGVNHLIRWGGEWNCSGSHVNSSNGRTRTFTQRNGFVRTNKPIEISRILVPYSKSLSRIDFCCISKEILQGLSIPIQPSQKTDKSKLVPWKTHLFNRWNLQQ